MIRSEDLKQEVLELLLWEKNFLLATTEFNNWYWLADVFWVSRTMFSWEFEIKVSKQDLLSELFALELILNKDIPKLSKRYYNKYLKHNFYLNKHNVYWKYILPNYFIFFIPKKLEKFCIDILSKTKYWIYIYDEEEMRSSNKIKCVKKPSKIHNEKIKNDYILDIARRLSNENLNLRKKRNLS